MKKLIKNDNGDWEIIVKKNKALKEDNWNLKL